MARQILENSSWHGLNDAGKVVMITLLMLANHKDKNWYNPLTKEQVLIKRGQCVTGRKSLAKRCSIGERSVRTALTLLKTTNFLTIQPTNKFSIITIMNYEHYQNPKNYTDQVSDQQSDQQATSKRPASDHKQQCNNEKNENISYVDWEQSTLTLWNSFCEKHPTLTKIREVSDKRRQHLKKRFERESFRGFAKILAAILEQPFLMGENDRKWKLSFDWLIENDTNYLKVLELRYKDKIDKDIKTANPDCQICAGTGWDETGEGKTICHCRLRK